MPKSHLATNKSENEKSCQAIIWLLRDNLIMGYSLI